MELKYAHGTQSVFAPGGADKRTGLDGGRIFRTSTYTVGKDFVVFQQSRPWSMGLIICLAYVMVGFAETVMILKLDVLTECGVFLWPNVY